MGIHYVCKLGTIYKYPIQLDCSLFICKFCHFRLALFLLHFRLWIKNLSNTVKIEFQLYLSHLKCVKFFKNDRIYEGKLFYIFFNRVLSSISHFIPRILYWFTTDWDKWGNINHGMFLVSRVVFPAFDNIFHVDLMRGFQKYGRNWILNF